MLIDQVVVIGQQVKFQYFTKNMLRIEIEFIRLRILACILIKTSKKHEIQMFCMKAKQENLKNHIKNMLRANHDKKSSM